MDPQDKPVSQSVQNDMTNSLAPSGQTQQVQQDDSINSTTNMPVKEISLPTEAEDLDLIEKEWVERAKEIVEHTADDPYEQHRALNQMKADYLKKRYGKDIKISEG